jgi:hypothetical protein
MSHLYIPVQIPPMAMPLPKKGSIELKKRLNHLQRDVE